MIKKMINALSKKRNVEAEGIYRFSIIKVHQKEVGYDCKINDYAEELPFNGFTAPKGMTVKQMYKTLSYILKQIKQANKDVDFASREEIEAVYKMLPQYRFEVVGPAPINANRLSVITGKCYKETKVLFEPHQEQWFDALVSKAQIEKIYNKLGLQLPVVENVKNHRSVV